MSITTEAPSTRAQSRGGGSAVLERAVAAMTARRRAEVEVLEAALAWAHAHVPSATMTTTTDDVDAGDVAGWRSDTIATPGSYASVMFGERAVPIAGVGTPAVGEFAVMELAAALRLSHEAALALVGDVLDLAHRLPRTWALVRGLRVPAHLGREAARVSRDLDLAAAGHADRLLVWQPGRLNPHRVGVLIHEARLYADPDRAVADHDRALDSRRSSAATAPAPPARGRRGWSSTRPTWSRSTPPWG